MCCRRKGVLWLVHWRNRANVVGRTWRRGQARVAPQEQVHGRVRDGQLPTVLRGLGGVGRLAARECRRPQVHAAAKARALLKVLGLQRSAVSPPARVKPPRKIADPQQNRWSALHRASGTQSKRARAGLVLLPL
jgi:hypothetical protein